MSKLPANKKTLRINGVARFEKPSAGSLVIDHLEAMKVILAAESVTPTIEEPHRGEAAAMVSHWLQSPKGTIPFVSDAQKEKWLAHLRNYCQLKDRGLVSGLPPQPKHSRPLHVDFSLIPFPPTAKPRFTFIDLFAGIGGFRIALQERGGKCVFSSEWDEHSKQTYFENFGEVPFGDLRQFTGEDLSDEFIKTHIPDHDVLAGGFPCQPFSLAGVSARSSLGQSHGFSCRIQGTLFFDLMRIAKVKRPRVLFLENVKNLKSHDGGRTFERIKNTIEHDLGYTFHSDVIDASPLVPQKRKRCYMVCFRDESGFELPSIEGDPLPLSSVLEANPPDRYTLSDRMWEGHQNRTQRNIKRGAGFTAYAAELDKPSNTIVARYYKDGKECLVPQRGKNPRLLTPRECARLQGFPEEFTISKVQTQAYRQFGNSVAVPVIGKIADAIVSRLTRP
jgi:DNA (cytosine-5)-methyltransferase 1